ncbi:hypothetical protein [Neisseria animalis]|uniref:Uncharacterized protein n=1 Tax=Neisseria animalis TaxID=492 RepID=A0A5P3MT22_NEIAN|nr:hypothetical protein [Neisseria animalis]QEY24762.1 hypothetical protein D0T90_10045 [Neisseria animalis]ROW31838.1 hypothetical protein CGZ60_08125 [Neisseria animalis]VEE07767.1 Uncharacterised protein [Neisseria animalis]
MSAQRNNERELLELEIKLARLHITAAHTRYRHSKLHRPYNNLPTELLSFALKRRHRTKRRTPASLLLPLFWQLIRLYLKNKK